MLNFRLESQNNKDSTETVENNSTVTIPEPTPPISQVNEVYTPFMSYPPYGSRGNMPYPTAYATVTPNVTKFSSGLSIEEIVNKIRFNISYFDHKTEGYQYMTSMPMKRLSEEKVTALTRRFSYSHALPRDIQ